MTTPLHVCFTVDVESGRKGTPRERIWGELPNEAEAFGIGKMMDMLDAHGVKGTFFLTPYEAALHGEADLARAAHGIHARGHDLALHTHPVFMRDFYYMSDVGLEPQVEALKLGMDMLERWSGKRVIAHRAGALAANAETLAACAEVGIAIDSSVCSCERSPLSAQAPSITEPFMCAGVWELPATCYTQFKLPGWRSNRLVDIEGSSLAELKTIVRQARDAGLSSLNVMAHSFSFVRYGYADRRLVKKLDDFIVFLKHEPGVAMATVTEAYQAGKQTSVPAPRHARFMPYTGWWLTYLRAVSDYHKGWKNRLLALAIPLVLAAIALAWMWDWIE